VRGRLHIALLLIGVMACGADQAGPVTVTLMTHDSFADAVTEETFAAFTARSGHQVEVLAAGDAGAMVNQAVLTRANPLADAIFGIDDTFLTRAVEADILEGYTSSLLDRVPVGLQLAEGLATPIDYGDVCVNYDKEAFGEQAPPASLDDLADPAYRGMLVVEDPTISSPGLAFLLATIERFGEQGWQQYWSQLRSNEVLIAPGWTEAYYGEFSGGAGEGTRPLVVSYASSPPAEVIFADPPVTEAPTGVITDGCYRQVEFVAALAGTEALPAVSELIDFMLSTEFQNTIPLTWFVFPANQEAELPVEFTEHTEIPAAPIQMDPELIEANRQRWLEEWAEVMR
jgi:thiamine transport system substrate-binding protein